MRRHRTAFTLIELTIVIAIIALITGLLVMGISKMGRTMKAKATAADLENIQSFFDEMNAHAGMNTSPVNWLWRNVTYTAPAAPVIAAPAVGTTTPNFWKIPNTLEFGGNPPVVTDALDAQPGTLADTDGSGMELLRNGSRAVLNTQLAMYQLLSYPADKAAVAKLPADRLFIPNWVSGSFPSTDVTGQDGISGSTDDSTDDYLKVCYAVNNCVKYDGATYRCIAANEAGSTTIPPTPGANGAMAAPTTYWEQVTDPTPLILDAWGNPLIFVPASGLINVAGNVDPSKSPSEATITVLNGTPVATNLMNLIPSVYARTLPPIQSPDNRPFFVSAGPDGDLSTGDDNIYSFSK